MDANIDRQAYEEIEKLISSTDSPVGIDAKKTHVLILHKLTQIEQRLARLERQTGLGGDEPPTHHV